MTLKLVKSDVRHPDESEFVKPEHIVAFEVYMLQGSIARMIELARLYPEIMAANLLALSECFAAFADFFSAFRKTRK